MGTGIQNFETLRLGVDSSFKVAEELLPKTFRQIMVTFADTENMFLIGGEDVPSLPSYGTIYKFNIYDRKWVLFPKKLSRKRSNVEGLPVSKHIKYLFCD